MITKVKYQIKALQPIHTGSDENYGTETRLRRERVLLPEPLIFQSHFANNADRRKAIAYILYAVWKGIDWDSVGRSRLMNIYDEFSGKMLASTGVRTKEQFLTRICQKWGIRSLKDDDVLDLLDKFNDDEFLDTVRNECQYLILLLRKIVKSKGETGSIEFDKTSSTSFVKSYDQVPYISGNSIRGLNRRLVMKDFCDRVGIDKLDKDVYHQLFTGGNITESTGFEDIVKRQELIAMCPMLGLFGSAIGNMTIQGTLKAGAARLKCQENGTGPLNYWELVETNFATRLDSSKTEYGIDIDETNPGKNKSANQMKYEYEAFVKGAEFDSVMAETSGNDLLMSAFWHMLKLFSDYGYIAGNSARDNGLIQINTEHDYTPESQYAEYLEANKSQIKKYFNETYRASS